MIPVITPITFEDASILYSKLTSKDFEFLPHFDECHDWYFGAYLGSKLIGFISGAIAEDCIFTTIAVLPDYRRTGVGKILLKELIEKAQSRKLKAIIWRCHKDNKASENLVISCGGEYVSEDNKWKKFKIQL